MDGYAVRHEDVFSASDRASRAPESDRRVSAGRPYEIRVRPGKAVRIMTGGLVPLGADTVVMAEASRVQGDTVELMEDPGHGANVRVKGQFLRSGEVLLNRGDLIGPPEVGPWPRWVSRKSMSIRGQLLQYCQRGRARGP